MTEGTHVDSRLPLDVSRRLAATSTRTYPFSVDNYITRHHKMQVLAESNGTKLSLPSTSAVHKLTPVDTHRLRK